MNVQDNSKTPCRAAFLPRNLNSAMPIGGASLIMPGGDMPDPSSSPER